MDDFVGLLHLDSNVIDARSSNTAASFTNYLASTYRYTSDNYEVGLLEMHFPFTWYNLTEESFIGVFDSETDYITRDGFVTVKTGFYPTIESLLDECNNAMKTYFYRQNWKILFPTEEDEKPFFYNPTTKRVNAPVSLGKPAIWDRGLEYEDEEKWGPITKRVYCRFTPQLAQLLGFDDHCFSFQIALHPERPEDARDKKKLIRKIQNRFPDQEVRIKSGRQKVRSIGGQPAVSIVQVLLGETRRYKQQLAYSDLRTVATADHRITTGLEKLFVYCNLVKQSVIGNMYKQILRVDSVYPQETESRKNPIVLRYDRPYYFPLIEPLFDHIEIELRDREGQLIKFESGSTIVVLEIRAKKHAESLRI